jgi:hypothetical protein
VGSVELSKRQDWCCECSEKVLSLIDPLRDYLVHQLVLDSNVLKDSTFQRLELRQFAAYVHTLAVMWLVVFEELRALTNSTIIKLNPMELPQLCDHLWKFADVLVPIRCQLWSRTIVRGPSWEVKDLTQKKWCLVRKQGENVEAPTGKVKSLSGAA